MRITLDTNVLVSAFIAKQGHPANLLQLALTLENIELVLSAPILREFRDVLMRSEVRSRFSYTEHDIERILNTVRASTQMVSLKSKFKMIREDPNDNVILNTAYDGKAEYIVSGDGHLLKLRTLRGIKIVNPEQMMDIVSRRFPEFISDF